MIRSQGLSLLPFRTVATPVLDEYDLIVGDSGQRFSNAGAEGLVALNLAAPDTLGAYYDVVSVSNVGMRLRCMTYGVFISYNGQLGTRFTTSNAGATCTIEATSSAIWTVVETSGDWTLTQPEEDEFSSELLAWRDAVEDNGGSVSIDAMIVRDMFIFKEKASGAWDLTDDYLHLWGENEAQALTSLKQRLLSIANGSPLFTSNSGFSFDGYSQYLDTSFIPSTHAVAMTALNRRLAVYCVSDQQVNGSAIGVYDADGLAMSLRPRRSGGNMFVAFNPGSAFFAPIGTPTAIGLSVGSTSEVTTIRGYKNGARLTDQTGLAISPVLLTNSIFIGARNYGGAGIDSPLACSVSFAAYGAQLSDAQEADQYANVKELAIHYGMPV